MSPKLSDYEPVLVVKESHRQACMRCAAQVDFLFTVTFHAADSAHDTHHETVTLETESCPSCGVVYNDEERSLIQETLRLAACAGGWWTFL